MSALSPRLAKLTLVPTATFLAGGLALLILAGGPWYLLLTMTYVAALAALGLLVVSRHPTNRIFWILIGLALVIAIFFCVTAFALYGVLENSSVPGWREAAGVSQLTWSVADLVPAVLLLLFLPNGRLLSPRWRVALWLGALGLVTTMAAIALWPTNLLSLGEFSSIENPFGIEGAETALTAIAFLGAGLLLAIIVAAAASLVLRFRQAHGDERQQLKWVASGAVVWAMALVIGVAFFEVFPWAEVLVFLAPVAIVVTTAIAILKYRLYDIDVVIRRTLVYGALTALLAGAYLAIVIALQQAFRPLTGGSDLAIAISTLVVAALFVPARRRIQGAVDRRFYRRKVDAVQTLEAFSARLREEIDLEALDVELRTVVIETMQPSHVSLWIRGVQR